MTVFIFHKAIKKDEIPLVLLKLVINNYKLTKAESIKSLGVFLGENLTWKEHIKYKKIDLLFKAKTLQKVLLVSLLFLNSQLH